MEVIDGKQKASEIESELSNLNYPAGLAIVLIGDHKPSMIYVKRKKKLAEKLGIRVRVEHLDHFVSEHEALNTIDTLNHDETIDGIIVQLPVSKHLDAFTLTSHVYAHKDIDGLHPMNLGLLEYKKAHFVPCTPQGCCQLILSVCDDLAGKRAVVIGRSVLVGKTLATLLTHMNATVTLVHSKTQDVKEICRDADIIITAIGQAHFLTPDYVRDGAIIIDVGINIKDDKITGDVDFEAMRKRDVYLTPVPKGVGPMTVINLMVNTYRAYCQKHDLILPDIIRTCTKFY